MSDVKSRPPFCSPFSSLPSQVGWETVGAGGGDEGRAGRFAGPSLFAGFGCEVRKGEKPPPLRVRPPPPPQNIHRGGRRGLGMLPPQSACWEGKNKPENGEEEWGASIGNDGVGDLGFFLGGGAAQERRSDPRKEKRRGCDPPPLSPPPQRTPEG